MHLDTYITGEHSEQKATSSPMKVSMIADKAIGVRAKHLNRDMRDDRFKTGQFLNF